MSGGVALTVVTNLIISRLTMLSLDSMEAIVLEITWFQLAEHAMLTKVLLVIGNLGTKVKVSFVLNEPHELNHGPSHDLQRI